MVPADKHRAIGKLLAMSLLLSAPLLAGCETTPLQMADSQQQPIVSAAKPTQLPRSKKSRAVVQRAVEVRVLPAAPPRPTVRTTVSVPKVVPRPAPRELNADRISSDSPPVENAEFEWPVEGKVIIPFGKDATGARNDGINIAAESGTPIHAAAAGTVIYAGDALKGYGNLVLIRHGNGFVTAYAHAQNTMVSRGDRVARGDVIGYAGKTGGVAVPQVHFEIRHGVKPIDPEPLLIGAHDT
ncbi:MAG: M23 family metallopeptidase [Alphaproteobacteria bacterium]|nr:M23 family metallopeptidase [Alphaproteobacteria bacterium]MBV9063563.1 M23 family metallopeptidase [Alphaproteobacteria bacterium]